MHPNLLLAHEILAVGQSNTKELSESIYHHFGQQAVNHSQDQTQHNFAPFSCESFGVPESLRLRLECDEFFCVATPLIL